MRRNRVITLLVAAVTALVAALMVAGGATARVGVEHSITLVTPASVVPGGALVLSGVTSPANEHVDLWEYPNATCSGDNSDWWHYGQSNGATGAYSETVTAPLVAGVYSYQAEIFNSQAWSTCNVVYVGAAPTVVPTSSGPDRYGYCSVAGNTDASGNPLGVGTFLNLLQGQPATDDHYTGATPAFWVEGVGITCDLTPAQAAIASASTVQVNHVGAKTPEEGPLFYTFVPQP